MHKDFHPLKTYIFTTKRKDTEKSHFTTPTDEN